MKTATKRKVRLNLTLNAEDALYLDFISRQVQLELGLSRPSWSETLAAIIQHYKTSKEAGDAQR